MAFWVSQMKYRNNKIGLELYDINTYKISQFQTNSIVTVFHLGYPKYLVKSVYLEGLLGLLVWIERERFGLI